MVSEMVRQAPYAPLANVIGLIRRRRDKGLPEIVTSQELTRMGIPEGNVSRVLQALRFLSLLDEEGRQTDSFNRLARASTNEYPEVLGEIIRSAYHDVFVIISDPETATDVEINDAFRYYQPQAQRNRMIILFRGLCQEAKIIKGGPPETRKRERVVTPKKPLVASQTVPTRKAHPKSEPLQVPSITPPLGNEQTHSKAQYGLLEGLLQQLPDERQWSQVRRERWLQAFIANVDLLIDVVDQEYDPSQAFNSPYSHPQ